MSTTNNPEETTGNPYEYTVRSAIGEELTFWVAPIPLRFLSFLTDFCIVMCLESFLSFLFIPFMFTDLLKMNASYFSATKIALLMIITFVFQIAYFQLFEYFTNGLTPGKRVFSLRVVAASGARPGFMILLWRNLTRILECSILPFIAGAVIFFDSRNRRIGDILSGTLVIFEQRFRFAGNIIYPEETRKQAAEFVRRKRAELSKETLQFLDHLQLILPALGSFARLYWLKKAQDILGPAENGLKIEHLIISGDFKTEKPASMNH